MGNLRYTHYGKLINLNRPPFFQMKFFSLILWEIGKDGKEGNNSNGGRNVRMWMLYTIMPSKYTYMEADAPRDRYAGR